ncbi:MAG: DUF4178 domain-containing protein [Myxococcales bacterium]|nr:DUF4178 domain-containing protein [Myxococcales bacterium]
MSQAPTKLFREEAQTGAIECPACGAPITLHAFGAIQQVACSYCGTVCNPEDDGNLAILQQAQRQRRESMLPLHRRGQLEGTTWEIIGITWREVVVDGRTYPWQEFLLFNPYAGYRWLIYAMSDGQWSLGGALPGAAKANPGMEPTVEWGGERYQHFTTATARTTYVEGEFPWQVLVNDRAETSDYICPPKLISIEVAQGEEGADINFTQMRAVSSRDVWKAFSLDGQPPPAYGVHPAAINPYQGKFYAVTGALLFVAWLVALVAYFGGRDNQQIFSRQFSPGEVISETLAVGEVGKTEILEFELSAHGMSNSWAYAEVLLVDASTEEAVSVGLEVDAWSGVEDGESWSEGTNPKRVVAAVPGGEYLLQVGSSQDDTVGGDKADSLELRITRDVPLLRYALLPLLLIIAFPFINFMRKQAFETRRWANSDHPRGGGDD